ncbi:MAG: HDOD domain-containing protein [Caldimicrobium sp.]
MGILEELIKKEKADLPLLPELAQKILQNFLVKSDRELEEFFITESEVSNFLIEIANSPRFRKGESIISSPRLALMVLGENTAKILTLGLISQKLMRTTFNEFSFPKFWARAISQAVGGYFFLDLLENLPKHLPISAFLMDYGILILYLINPEKYLKVLRLKGQGIPLLEAEKEIFETTHAEVGAEYFENYALPRRFILNILYHHNEDNKWTDLPKDIQEDLYFLKMIDHLVGSFFSTNREERWYNFKNLAQIYLKEEEIEALSDTFPNIANTYLSLFNLEEFKLKTFKELEKEKDEEIKKLQIIEKEKEISLTYTIESLKNKLLDLQRQKRELEREYEALRKRYEESSILDILTEVYKEEYFLRRLKEETLRAKRYGRVFSLLYIVIDKLGELGKKFGIGEEEKFLKKLASSFKSLLRRVDLVCKAKKWDTFYVILPETPSQGAMVVARKLLRRIEELYLKEYDLKYSAYITVLTFDPKNMDPKKEPSPQAILDLLEKGMELLRKRGQNKVLLLKLEQELEK